MRVVGYVSNTRRDKRLFAALKAGFESQGDSVVLLPKSASILDKPEPGDLAVFVGVRTSSMHVLEVARRLKQPIMMLDKGYFVRNRYHRVSLGSPQPTYVSRMDYPDQRLVNMGFRGIGHGVPRVQQPKDVVYVESTQKYYTFHGLGEVDAYSSHVCGKLIQAVNGHGLRVLHRPRKALSDAPPTPAHAKLASPGTLSFQQLLPGAHCVVVHGSNAGIEAMAAGVPVLSLGSIEVNPIHDLVNQHYAALAHPKMPGSVEAKHRLAQLAWCQFSLEEIATGFAWRHTKRWMP